MTASDTATRVMPYIEELLENGNARDNLRDAANHVGRALRAARPKPAARWGRRLALVVGVGVGAVGIALAADERLRAAIVPGQAEPSRDDADTGPREAPGASVNGADPKAATRAELYQEARRLGVQGRSKMTKAQLSAAVARGSRT